MGSSRVRVAVRKPAGGSKISAAAAATATAGCRHCRAPIPDGAPEGFCCRGCAAVHALLREERLGRFYELGGGTPVGEVPAPSRLDWLGDLERAGAAPGGLVRLTVDVQGIRCAACVWVIQELWRRRDGALRIDLNPGLGQATLLYDPARLQLGGWIAAVERLGYRIGPPAKRPPERGLLLRLGLCAAFAMNAMLFALAGYAGLADGPLHSLFGRISFVIATLAVLVGGPVFFRAALGGLRARVLHLDLPISLGILLAYLGSVQQFVGGAGASASYFDTVTIFITLMLAGRWLQQRAIERNRDFLLRNDGAELLRARRIDGDRIREVRIDAIEPGQILLLVPGDLVPVRAELLDPAASFSLDWIDGESAPRAFAAGATIPAGSFHAGDASVRLRALAGAEASGLLALLRAPPAEPGATARGSRFWAFWNRAYVLAVLLLALGGGVAWLFLDRSRALDVTVALLVVTCPCAIGIALPLAFDLALLRLRRCGIYVRNGAFLDKARRVTKVLFDKTGTLTWGGLRAETLRAPPPVLQDLLFTLASSSQHPAAKAVARALASAGPAFLAGTSVREVAGQGLVAEQHGVEYRLGSPALVLGDAASEPTEPLLLFSAGGHVEAAFTLSEDFRAGFAGELRALAEQGCELHMLSGDHPAKVRRAAEQLGFAPERTHGGMRPEQKAAYVRRIDRDDTLMVGDGLNDAPAFAAAFAAGTAALDRPVMPSRADFAIVGSGPGATLEALRTARGWWRVVRANLGLGLLYNLIVVLLALAGRMDPLLCAVLMPLSSLLLLAHTAWRLRSSRELEVSRWT